MDRISVEEATRNLADLLNVVANGKQRYLIGDGKSPSAAFLPAEDLELLGTLDRDPHRLTRVDVSQLRKRLRERIAASAAGTERFVVLRDGQEIAGLVSAGDVAQLVDLDGRIDLEAAKRLLERRLGPRPSRPERSSEM
jgi:PHD/YefM family antitoxin component YafN of YafNO toxin-antitoxin module